HLDKAADLVVLKMYPTAGQGQTALNLVEDEEVPSLHLLPGHPPDHCDERGGCKVAGGEPEDVEGMQAGLNRLVRQIPGENADRKPYADRHEPKWKPARLRDEPLGRVL